MNMRWLWVLALVFGLAACGSDDDTSSETPSVEEEAPPVLSMTGTITPAAGITFDSDLNDPASNITGTFTGNDTLQRAQPIANTAIVHGYASYRSTGVRVDRFGRAYDEFDTYSANLVAGQRIELHVVDFNNEPLNGVAGADLDLALLDENGDVVAASIGTGEFEKVDAPATGTFYIQVIGHFGISKYVLELGPGAPFSPETPAAAARFASNDLIVKFRERTGSVSALSVTNTYAGQLSHQDFSRASLLQLDTPTLSAASLGVSSLSTADRHALAQTRTLRTLKDLRARPDVEYAELNYLSQAQATSNDPGLAEQWHFRNINLPQAWDITTGLATPPVIVAVIDTGVYLEHPDLADKLVAGYDFISDAGRSRDGDGIDDNPDDPGDSGEPGVSSFHGTHVAGIVAASSNNGEGGAGVSWHAQIMPLRVLGTGGGEDYDIIQAIRFAAGLPNDSETFPERRADIINLSLGGYGQDLEGSQAYQGAIDAARAAGVIVVAGAGNDDSSIPFFPASLHGVISVSASNSENGRASYSNYGPMIDVAAPGGDFEVDDGIYSTWVDDFSGVREPSYASWTGTSMAAPHVAGVLALMKAVHPGLTPADVDAVLAAGSLTRDIGVSGRDNSFGFGLIDAEKAVLEAERLAAGGAVPPVAFRLQAQPYMLAASSLDNAPVPDDQIILRNLGSAPGTVQSVTVDESISWVTVGARVEAEVDGQMLGTYPVTINPESLEAGYHGTEITVTYVAAGRTRTLKIPVHLRVWTSGGIGRMAPQYALLLNQQGQTVVACPLPPSSEPQTFRFYDVEPGNYYMMAGSDIDQDERICEMGESCGALVAESEAELVEFDGGLLEGLNFDVGLDLSGWWPRNRVVTDEMARTTNAGCSSVREP